MADEPEAPAAASPAPRRRGPGKTAEHREPSVPKRRGRPPGVKTADVAKTAAAKVETAVAEVATKPVEVVTATVKKAAKVVKPRSTNRARPAPKKGEPKSGSKAKSRWSAAAIAGGVVAAGAATAAALFSLRGSTPKKAASKPTGAHQADGTNSSASYNAGIADEGSIPE